MTTKILSAIARHLNHLLILADHPGSGWNHAKRAFAHRLLLGLIMAGDTMLTAIVRQFPNQGVAMRHRYKAADRMLGEVELVPVAALRMEAFGVDMDDDHVIALDLSDISKKYTGEARHRLYLPFGWLWDHLSIPLGAHLIPR